MTSTGRKSIGYGEPILQCTACVASIRARLAPALEIGRRSYRGKHCRQIVLPPVVMSERWP